MKKEIRTILKNRAITMAFEPEQENLPQDLDCCFAKSLLKKMVERYGSIVKREKEAASALRFLTNIKKPPLLPETVFPI